MPEPTVPNLRVEAAPTKDLFISMLVKDIPLTRAVLDLTDNSVDGARRLRQDGDFSGLYVRLKLSDTSFQIEDNCGGIPVDIARNYAFRFGRPVGMQPTAHSVGQFGVGMKRALFKLGKKFKVTSVAADSSFVLEVDVDKWKDDPGEWKFAFSEVKENQSMPRDEWGTRIEVSALNPGVAEYLNADLFRSQLMLELEKALSDALSKRLTLAVNGITLHYIPVTLMEGGSLRPAVYRHEYTNLGDSPVLVKLFAGVTDSLPKAAGWYVYCNGRLVLGPDQSPLTGWGEGPESTVPKYHNQFSRFRGYAFVDSENAGLLPWNTTKTGVDADSQLYRAMKEEMVRLTRPVIDFLNKLDAEKDLPPEQERILEKVVEVTPNKPLRELMGSSTFSAPSGSQRPKKQFGYIHYSKPQEELRQVKARLGAGSNKEVGEKTFDYFFRLECKE